MKTFVASLLASLILIGCSSNEPPDETPMSGEQTGVRPAFDPVSGTEVRTDSIWKTRWNDGWYYFESEENLQKFQVNPTAYIPENGRPKRERRTVTPNEVR